MHAITVSLGLRLERRQAVQALTTFMHIHKTYVSYIFTTASWLNSYNACTRATSNMCTCLQIAGHDSDSSFLKFKLSFSFLCALSGAFFLQVHESFRVKVICIRNDVYGPYVFIYMSADIYVFTGPFIYFHVWKSESVERAKTFLLEWCNQKRLLNIA